MQETVLSDADDEDDDGCEYVPPSEEPSWAKKLKEKMKRMFYFQAKGQYKAHKEAKMARRRDKAIMRQVGLRLQMALRSGSLMRSLGSDCTARGLTSRRTPEFTLLLVLQRTLRRRRSMTGDAMEIYYHRVPCRPFPFGVLLPKGES